MKNYNKFCFIVLQRLMQDSDIFHDVYSEIKEGCDAVLYEKHIKAMTKAKLIEQSVDQYCAGTTFHKIRISQKGIDKFMELETYFKSSFNEDKESVESPNKKHVIKDYLVNIQKLLKSTQAIVATIITLVMTIGALVSELDIFKASLQEEVGVKTNNDNTDIPIIDDEEYDESETSEPIIEDENSETDNLNQNEDEDLEPDIPVNVSPTPKLSPLIPSKTDTNTNTNNDTSDNSKNITIPEENKVVTPKNISVIDENKKFYEKIKIELNIKNRDLKLSQNKLAVLEYSVNIKPSAKFKIDCGTKETSTLKSSTCTYRQAGKYNFKVLVFTKDGSSRIMKNALITVSE